MSDRFDLEALRAAVRYGRIRWRMHALQRILERGISRDHVKAVILNGQVIEAYATADPYPSSLIHGVINDRVLHVVAGWDGSEAQLAYVITAYEPDEAHFESDLRTRRRK